ncbi:MAG: Uncharacterised protein [Flavobacteriaceae bacterium]|nr:MAG: Uncharacterised protein [Flavobacteriaceae bacterium]
MSKISLPAIRAIKSILPLDPLVCAPFMFKASVIAKPLNPILSFNKRVTTSWEREVGTLDCVKAGTFKWAVITELKPCSMTFLNG